MDSAIGNHLPKVALLDAGLRLRDLIGWTNCRPWRATTFVLDGRFVAGAANLEEVQKLIDFGAPLRVLKEVRNPTMPWVANSDLPPGLRASIRQSLLNLKDEAILAGISRGLTGFRPVTVAEYDELDRQMARAILFDESPEPHRQPSSP